MNRTKGTPQHEDSYSNISNSGIPSFFSAIGTRSATRLPIFGYVRLQIDEETPISEEIFCPFRTQTHTETILVADNEPLVGKLAKWMLEKVVNSVLAAGGGKEGLDIYVQHKSEISLVAFDLIMLQMGGKPCLEELLKIASQAKVPIAIGFSEKGYTKKTFLDAETQGIVLKPFNRWELLNSFRHALDRTLYHLAYIQVQRDFIGRRERSLWPCLFFPY